MPVILSLFTGAIVLLAGLPQAQMADLVVTGARIYTVEPNMPRASSIAVKDGRILAIGSDVSGHIGPTTRRIDARGATIVPGLIDCHVHMESLGDMLETFDFRNTRTVGEIGETIRKAARDLPPGEWVRGRNWDQTNWGGSFPSHDTLSKAAPDHPVYLRRVDGHAGWANRKALELAGITAATKDPPGGKIIRDARGEPTGIFIDRAQGLVTARIPPATPDQVRRRLARAAGECARLGLTTVHDAGIGRRELDAYRALIVEKRLPVRVYAMIGGEGDLWREYLKRGPEIGERLTVRSIKLVSDGALGSRGAALWQPYSDDPGNTGLLILSREIVERVARDAMKAGFQVNTHAIGDRANRAVLDAYAAVLAGENDRRFRIEHAQVVSLPDFALFRKYSIIASMQATHATSDMRWAEARLGPDRVAGAYAWQRFLKLGVPVANGSDFPVEEPDPIPGFSAAVTRQDAQGNPPGGWMADQRMSREEALKSWTMTGAYAAFEEKWKGSLAPGKLADFVMLSNDIMEAPVAELRNTRVLLTVRGGEVVYSARP
jgi:predicted amidohydrolase YtcJ